MLQLPLIAERLERFGSGLGLWRSGDGDGGYLLHALLTALFGAAAPKPFVLQQRVGRPPTLLAYAPHDLPHLSETAMLKADPDVYRIVDWDHAAAKPMPAFRTGQRLGFSVRVRPVVRVGRAHPVFGAGAEVDAFLVRAEADREAPKPDRVAVYRDWLAARISIAGAMLDDMQLAGQRRTSLTRKNADGERRSRAQQIDVDLAGLLTVTDPAAFRGLLARGVGRHRTFGFGMLLLRPVD